MKRGWRILLILMGCGVVAFTGALMWPREREPEYQGKKLSEWLASEKKGGATIEAVEQIGTNGISYLLRWATYQTPRWKCQLFEAGEKWIPRFDSEFHIRLLSMLECLRWL